MSNKETLAPTPTNFNSITLAPTPTDFHDNGYTLAPTPTTFMETTRNPTPTNFIPPTAAPTTEAALTTGQIIIITVSILVVVGAFIFYYWYFSQSKDSKKGNYAAAPTEESPFIEESSSSSDGAWKGSTIANVLGAGIVIKLHTAKGPKDVKMSLSGSELRWDSLNLMTRKRYKLDLNEVLFVEWGKNTHNFHKPTASSAPDDHCFSLVSQSTTLDLEVLSDKGKPERDMLASGFDSIIGALKKQRGSV